jgi:geranylgeranyl pyrophosphate synthase
MILAFERCNKDQKKWLRDCLRNKPLGDKNVQSVIELYRDFNVIESARSKMEELYDSAEQSLEIFGETEDKRDLIKLIRTLKKRDH